MNEPQGVHWRKLASTGLLAGLVIVYVGLIGMIETFSEREIVVGVITLGQLLVFVPALAAGYVSVRRHQARLSPFLALLQGIVVGVFSALPPILLVIIITNFDIRAMFVNASPVLADALTFGLGGVAGNLALLAALTGLAALGGLIASLPKVVRGALISGFAWVVIIGLFSELIGLVLDNIFGNRTGRIFFSRDALRPIPAAVIFGVVALFSVLWSYRGRAVRERYDALSPASRTLTRRVGGGLGAILLLMLPWILGVYLSEVLVNVGLYIMMALGLNIAVGLAGLLDLGYVTNFAVGAYVMGVLSSTGPLGRGELNFWLILPVSVLSAMATGFILALPVLRMRGDYLAIATLGFGEIIRILALSDWLAPLIGGAQGVLFIPAPSFFGFVFDKPQKLYYIILFACLLVLFVSVRLNNSRTGRQWMALREDEDAAGAMGIDTMLTKLLAFTLSAASGGLAGAIFASKLGAIFPHSFSLLISINVLSIIIVGGMGSIPGIVVGAFALIGTPELLREFSEYRLLIYGALLIVMMLVRPEGLWPSAVHRRELADDTDVVPTAAPAAD